jgi:hypothetical protein
MSQSDGLSDRQKQRVAKGLHLNDDSKCSEKVLTNSILEIIIYAEALLKPRGFNVVYKSKITLYECQQFFAAAGGPKPDPDHMNEKCYMCPDGGILFAVSGDIRIPILITEDKVQGTNDILF